MEGDLSDQIFGSLICWCSTSICLEDELSLRSLKEAFVLL